MTRCFETINLNKTSAAKLTCLFLRKWPQYSWPWPGSQSCGWLRVARLISVYTGTRLDEHVDVFITDKIIDF